MVAACPGATPRGSQSSGARHWNVGYDDRLQGRGQVWHLEMAASFGQGRLHSDTEGAVIVRLAMLVFHVVGHESCNRVAHWGEG